MKLKKDKIELRKEYFSWLNKNQEQLKPIISKAIDSIYNVFSKHYDSTDIVNIKKGLELNHMFCWALGKYVNNFAENDENFKNLIVELSQHPSSKVRLNIVTNCLYNKPKHLVDYLLLEALNDKSKKVRLKVADVMLRLNKENLAKNLLERTEIETDDKVKNTMLWTYELISKKWTYEPEWGCIKVHLKDGGVSGFYLKENDDVTNIKWIEQKVEKMRNRQ